MVYLKIAKQLEKLPEKHEKKKKKKKKERKKSIIKPNLNKYKGQASISIWKL